MYPVVLDITDKKCLVVGGGPVACRKVEGLLAAGAQVVIVSPEVEPEIQALAQQGRCRWHRREYAPEDLKGAFLVFAATSDPALQQQIALEGGRAGIPVNVVDQPKLCTFHVPATIRHGDFLLAIATGGNSPALAARVRRELERQYGPEYGILVRLLGRLRPLILERCATQAERKTLFQNILHDDILCWIREQRWERLRIHLEDIVGAEGGEVLSRIRQEEGTDHSGHMKEGC